MKPARFSHPALLAACCVGFVALPVGAQTVPDHAVEAVSTPGHPSPDDVRASRQHSALGTAAFTRGDFATALGEFRTAWQMDPRPSVRAAMANCYVALHRPVEAIHHLEDYLHENPRIPLPRQALLQRRIAALESRVAEVTLRITPPGPATDAAASVTVDDTPVSPTHSFRVAAGHHVVEVRATDYRLAHVEFDARGHTTPTVAVALELTHPRPPEPVAVQPVTVPPTPPPAPPAVVPNSERAEFSPAEPEVTPLAESGEASHDIQGRGIPPGLFYAVAGATTASAIAWGLCAGLSLVAVDDFHTATDGVSAGTATPGQRQAGTDAYYRARQFTLWSEMALVTTLVGAVAGAVLYLKTDFHRVSTPWAVARAVLAGGIAF